MTYDIIDKLCFVDMKSSVHFIGLYLSRLLDNAIRNMNNSRLNDLLAFKSLSQFIMKCSKYIGTEIISTVNPDCAVINLIQCEQ